MTRPTGSPCWIDLLTSDADSARQFYPELFGWTAGEASPEFGGYFMFFGAGGQPVAGCMPARPGSGAADGWTVYLATDNVKALTGRALAQGGALGDGPLDIADLGSEAVLADAVGARVGAWQAGQFGGFPPDAAGPGTPGYFELITRGYQRALDFYAGVFGWNGQVVSDTPEFRLTTLADGGQTLAGIMDGSAFLAADQEDRWNVYFRVADTDAALATVVRLGGTVAEPAMDTPYGRLAAAVDSRGARFKVMG